MIDELVKQYSEIDKKPAFFMNNGRIQPADRLGYKGRSFSDTEQALTALGQKIVKYMTTIKYAQDKLGDDFIKLAVDEYG